MRHFFVAAALSFAVSAPAAADTDRDDRAAFHKAGPAAKQGEVGTPYMLLAQSWRRAAENEPKANATAADLARQARIVEIQKHLTTLGYDPGPANGVNGKQTRAAIQRYQKDSGFSEEGHADPLVLERLTASVSRLKSARPTAPKLSGHGLTSEIQNKLAALGYDPGPADGLMGWKTRTAIRSYQSRAGLPVDGEVSAGLLERLRGTPAGRDRSGGRPANA